jgi:hypothetical protein
MHPLSHPRPNRETSSRPQAEPGPLAALWRDLAGSWRHAWAQARVEAIDEATLRDLGVARCELESFRAETEGRAAHTRLRVARGTAGGR